MKESICAETFIFPSVLHAQRVLINNIHVMALKSKPQRLRLFNALGPHARRTEMYKGMTASSIMQDGLKCVVTWKDDVAKRRVVNDSRGKIEKVITELNAPSRSILNSKARRCSERDRRIGTILWKYSVKGLLRVKGERGLAFTVNEITNVGERESCDSH